jgi:hypothetical protein
MGEAWRLQSMREFLRRWIVRPEKRSNESRDDSKNDDQGTDADHVSRT